MRKDQFITKLDGTINNVADYITAIDTLVSNNKSDNRIFVFRGEPQKHETYCTPNIFRKDVLSSNTFYEKSLFNAMRQNKLTNSNSYLENAIDAQHGEFPSRLLDVSYNCLNALYFAVTPYYHHEEDHLDNKDGMVYVFYIDDIFSPSAENTNNNYNAIINKSEDWFNNQAIFEKNHKFIDHSKINNRIIVQQGAFILFQGNDAESVPTYMMNGIIIPKESKPKIRHELSLLFGINTGTVYPEIVNLAADITNKSKMLVTEKFCWENELKYVLKNFEKELNYYTDYLFLSFGKKTQDPEYLESVQMVEMIINSYRIGLIKFDNDFKNSSLCKQDPKLSYKVQPFLDAYNAILDDFKKNLFNLCNTKISDELFIKEQRNELS